LADEADRGNQLRCKRGYRFVNRIELFFSGGSIVNVTNAFQPFALSGYRVGGGPIPLHGMILTRQGLLPPAS
jgi:hypothetical protein